MHEPISSPPKSRRGPASSSSSWCVILTATVVLGKINTNDYALTPGDATPVAPLVKIKGVASATHHGKIMLTDVYLTSLDGWQWLYFHLKSHVQFVSGDEFVDPGVSTAELGAQGYLEMSDAKQAAEVAAFRTLGWKVPSTPTGAIVTAVESDVAGATRRTSTSPTRSSRSTGRRSTRRARSSPPCTRCRPVRRLHSRSGALGSLRPERSRIGGSSTDKVTTVKPPKGLAPSGCPGRERRRHVISRRAVSRTGTPTHCRRRSVSIRPTSADRRPGWR